MKKPECQRWLDGSYRYVLDGKLHRDDDPAVISMSGTKEWFQHGQWHREDGPAIEWSFGKQEWYLFDKEYLSKKEYFKALAKLRGQEWADKIKLIYA